MKQKLYTLILISFFGLHVFAQSEILLGNPSDDAMTDKDGWNANMIILLAEDQVYENLSGESENVEIIDFNFYAYESAENPITPIIGKFASIDSINPEAKADPVIIAIGTTRTADDYVVAQENSFPFNQEENPVVTLENGEVLVVGFMDAYPDGTGGGKTCVVPNTSNAAHPLWYCGGATGEESGIVTLNEEVDVSNCDNGTAIYTLIRTYAFNMFVKTGLKPVSIGANLNIDQNIEVYPTFVQNGQLTIKSQIEVADLELRIIDVSGKLVYSSVLTQDLSVVDLSDIQSGIYLANIYCNKQKVCSEKIIFN